MMFPKNVLLFTMLFILSFFVPRVSAQIPEVGPPTRDEEGTERDWDISHPGWREKRAEAARQKEEARQLRLKKAQDAANNKSAAKERKAQAYAEALRQKEAKQLEQKRNAEMEAEKKQKDRERKADALDMMKRFQKATAEVDMPASTNTKADEIIYEQNNLFVDLLNHDAISSEEKQKYSLNLTIYNEQTTYKVLMSKVPPMQGGFIEDYGNSSDKSPNLDADFDTLGLKNVYRLFAKVAGKSEEETMYDVVDFVAGTPPNVQMAIAKKGRNFFVDYVERVKTNTLKELDNAVNLLTAQPGLSQDFVYRERISDDS